MERSSKVHYIAPGKIRIIANANGNCNDLALYVNPQTTIKVYSEGIGQLGFLNNTYREWQLEGKNRRIIEDAPYTIYARLSKTDIKDGYIIFSPKILSNGIWFDKYIYITETGFSQPHIVDGQEITVTSQDYWYIKIGDVTKVDDQGRRYVEFDGGVLGTVEYSNTWKPEAEELSKQMSLLSTSMISINGRVDGLDKRVSLIKEANNLIEDENPLVYRAQKASAGSTDAQTNNLYTGRFNGFLQQKPMVITSEYIAQMTGGQNYIKHNEGSISSPIIPLENLTPYIFFYSSDENNLPVSGFNGLAETWRKRFADNENYDTSSCISIILPFDSPLSDGTDTIPFRDAMIQRMGETYLAEEEEIRARSFVGNYIDITNFSHENISLFGLIDRNNVLPADLKITSAWEEFCLLPSMRMRARCILDNSENIYWEVETAKENLHTYQQETWLNLGLSEG